jgi:hypothetical protein
LILDLITHFKVEEIMPEMVGSYLPTLIQLVSSKVEASTQCKPAFISGVHYEHCLQMAQHLLKTKIKQFKGPIRIRN